MQTKTALRIRNRWSKATGTPVDITNYQSSNYGVGLQWNAPWGNVSSDGAMRYRLFDLRAKSKALETQNPYAERFFGELETNVISSDGMVFQSQIKQETDITLRDGTLIPAGGPDKGANGAVEDAWYDFWHTSGHCDVTGELSGIDFDKLWLRATARDGAMPVRIIRGFDNDWNFALQAFEADQFDLNYNEVLSNGNEIRMSVEKDQWGRRVAYYLTPYNPGDWMTTYGSSYFGNNQGPSPWSTGPAIHRDRIRIPADEIICIFPSRRVGQTWGWPWLTPVLDEINGLLKVQEAEITACRAEAEKMAYFVRTEGAEEYTGQQDADGNFSIPSTPGMNQSLPVGWDVRQVDPKHPNGNFAEFRKVALRTIASGIQMSYGNLANDRSDSSFSAERAAIKNEQEAYKMIQRWFIDGAKMRVFSAWLEVALAAGKITLPNGSALPLAKLDKFNKPFFQGRRWGYVLNPMQEIQADILAVDNGFVSRRSVIAENGKYVEDVFDEIEQDNELAMDRGEGKDPLVFADRKLTGNFESEKALADAFGVAERAGAITPSRTDEQFFREKLNLPEMSPEITAAWDKDGGVRRPITLTQPDGSRAPVSQSIDMNKSLDIIKAMPSQPQVTVNVPPPVVNIDHLDIPQPIINVAAPEVTVNVPDQPAPIVNVTTPDVTVNVPKQTAPKVNVDVPPPPTSVDLERDADGKIVRASFNR